MALNSKRRLAKIAGAIAAAVILLGLALNWARQTDETESESAQRLAGLCARRVKQLDLNAGGRRRSRMGSWRLCLDGPYRPDTPCFAFSFGDGIAWPLEAEFAAQFKCQVLVFGPHTPPGYLSANDRNPYFLREGLQSPDNPDARWFTAGYLDHLRRFNAEGLVIDVLKIDMSGNSALPAVVAAAREGSLKTAKQLLVSVLASWVFPVELTQDQLQLIELLRQAGFLLWHKALAEVSFGERRRDDTEPRFHLHFINAKFALARPQRNPQGSEIPDPLGRLPIVKLPGYSLLREIQLSDLASMSESQLEQLYYQAMATRHVHCPHARRIGAPGDGGWDVCFSPPLDIRRRKPCVTFSFGIDHVYHYDDVLAEEFNCRVYMFDPSMGVEDHKRLTTSWFFNTGLSSNNTVAQNGWKMRTLCTLFSELGYADSEIDILKIDVEFWEWISLEKAMQEGCLKRVRQLLFETHTSGLFSRDSDYASFILILRDLYSLGFAAWHTSLNVHSVYYMARPCCHEHYLINTHFLPDFQRT